MSEASRSVLGMVRTFLAVMESAGLTAAPVCELGALDLYDAGGLFIERIEFVGDHHSLAIDLAHVVPRLLAVPCRMVVLHHCHPSGIAQPSEADIVATRAFAGLLRLLGMRLHDHVIAGHGASFSFRAQGLI